MAVNVNPNALQFVNAQRGSDLNSSPRSRQTNELKEGCLCHPVLCGQSQQGLEHTNIPYNGLPDVRKLRQHAKLITNDV